MDFLTWQNLNMHLHQKKEYQQSMSSMSEHTLYEIGYYSDNKFAQWFDWRSAEDSELHGVGSEQDSKQDIKVDITKNYNCDGTYIMLTSVVLDARFINETKFGNFKI